MATPKKKASDKPVVSRPAFVFGKAEAGGPAMGIRFTRDYGFIERTYSPFLRVFDRAVDHTIGRELVGVTASGEETIATSHPDSAGWTIVVEPTKGFWDAEYFPIDPNA